MTDHERIARFVSEVGRVFYAPTSHQQEATMAKDFDNTNRGALFKNDEKDGENDRDYSGTLNVEGREFWVSGWVKTSKKGQKFLSLSVKPKHETTTSSAGSRKRDMDDAIPF
jgi:hypothetical protein